MCSKFVAMYSVARRRPSAVATIASACGATAFSWSCIVAKKPSVSSERLVARRPPAGRGERHDRRRPAARGELQRDVAAERVADDVRGLEARVVHRTLDRVGDRGGGDRTIDGGPARVAGQRRGEYLVTALELRQHQVPGPPGVGEAVQADER